MLVQGSQVRSSLSQEHCAEFLILLTSLLISNQLPSRYWIPLQSTIFQKTTFTPLHQLLEQEHRSLGTRRILLYRHLVTDCDLFEYLFSDPAPANFQRVDESVFTVRPRRTDGEKTFCPLS
jgi:hypothetical protein